MNTTQLGYEGEFGWYHAIATGFDASAATSIVFRYKAPDGTRTDKTAAAVTTLAAGDFEYLVESGFFTKGDWQVQVHILQGATALYKSAILRFSIGPAISAS